MENKENLFRDSKAVRYGKAVMNYEAAWIPCNTKTTGVAEALLNPV